MALDAADLLQIGHRADVRHAVGELYKDFQREVAQRKPACSASGNCCRFRAYGHRLYVTTIELAVFAASLDARAEWWSFDPKAPEQGICPLQFGNLCSVHTIRPFGCQVFFCDATAADWQREQYEAFHARLKALHDRLDIPYRYMEWLSALKALEIPARGLERGDQRGALSLPQLRL
ncbi:MAG TPA: hypothetical protein VF669_16150 [Tepidisphaeraceae bacterium]|jgi:Fe-S-cluster containining protein